MHKRILYLFVVIEATRLITLSYSCCPINRIVMLSSLFIMVVDGCYLSSCSFSNTKIDNCYVTGYNQIMIKSFAHKGLKDFFYTESKKGIKPEHATRLARMLDRLDASLDPQDMNLPGYDLHPLKGDKRDMWSVSVSGNWRMTFFFEEQDAYLVNYLDYH